MKQKKNTRTSSASNKIVVGSLKKLKKITFFSKTPYFDP